MKASEMEYRLKFFLDNGFQRKECKVCKTPFWTLDRTREDCADIPCSDYHFLDMKEGPLNWSVSESRKKFLEFFRKRGHEIIPPKPVLARWREDLYLTIASIVDFQPYITSGLVPPPANPLVISQPCIRMDDVDNVGITFGRHLTTFEMGGHHAFNYPDKFVYWKDETVSYAKEFFTKELGISEDLLNFKESWWEGGGNAGPSFEVTVGGLELATLVFMQYEISAGDYVPLKLKIVDTGYGIERIAWFTQKTPTAFHAIYGNLVDTFFDKLGQPRVDSELLRVASRFAGRIDPDNISTLVEHRNLVAKALGIPVDVVKDELNRAARIFQVLDHTKTVALMLGDGLVPSSSGEGYLGRLLIRRALRTLKFLGTDVKLSELVKLQINFWGYDFPQLLRNRDYILDVVDVEQEKFQELISKTSSLSEFLSKSKRSIGLEDLVELYDSNGIPPDIIADELRKKGIQIEVPHNFYSIVAKRHQVAPLKKDKDTLKLPEHIINEVKDIRATEALYYKDQYARSFDATVLLSKSKYLVLDRTLFYPEGGGQLGDQGWIILNGDRVRVVDTQKVGDIVVHILDREINLEKGMRIEGEIDWERRFRLMRHHTATHVVLAAAKKLLGDHVWQAGAEKTPQKARLDITHYKPLTAEEIRKIEDMANSVINDRRPVRPFEINRVEAEMRYGVSIYEGGVPNKANIRLLEIEGWDVESCGGTHVWNTGDIGAIKIVKTEKIQDGIIRLEYVAGDMVSRYARELEDKLVNVSSKLETSSDQLEMKVEKLLREHQEAKNLIAYYRKEALELLSRSIQERSINGIRLIILPQIKDQELEKELMRRLTSQSKTLVVHITQTNGELRVDLGTSRDIDVKGVVERLKEMGGKGGGRGTFGSMVVANKSREEIIDYIKETIERGGL